MFSLQQIFGKGDKFFDLLEASAEEARTSVQSLINLLQTQTHQASLDEFILSRRKDKRITEQIGAELVRTFVTGLEREDIEALSNALYKIPKTVEKFAERANVAGERVRGVDFARHVEMLGKATDVLVEMVRHLRKIPPLERVKELNDRIQLIEGNADNLMLEVLKDLYNGGHDPVKVVIMKDLYELLEKVIDRCRDAGNVIYHIVLKNS